VAVALAVVARAAAGKKRKWYNSAMNTSFAERRQIENEMIFRRMNEKVTEELKALDDMHREDGHYDLVRDDNLKLQFYCECSDEDCRIRISMLLTDYQHIHKERDVFVVVPGHQVESIEEVVKKTKNYDVVKKDYTTSEPTGGLRTTPVSNI
jgi:hypothetical protein